MQYPDTLTRQPRERRPYANDGFTIGDVRRLVAMGEGLHIEFKQRVPEGDRVAREVTALANTRGGRLIVGVTDDGEIVGVRDSEEEEFSLHEALQQHCEPPVRHSIRRIPLSRRRDVLLVEVPESTSKPHAVVDGLEADRRTVYVRVDDMSVEASREAVRLMKADGEAAAVRFEFGEKELKLMRYLDEYGRISVDQFARIAGVPRRTASHTLVLLTRGGLLAHHLDAAGDYFTVSSNGGS